MRSSLTRQKDRFQRFVTRLQEEQEVKYSYSWTTTLLPLNGGSFTLSRYLKKDEELAVLVDLQSSLLTQEKVGTFSVTVGRSELMISYFVEDVTVCLDIFRRRERGLLERVVRIALMRVKSIFWKPVTWLSEERRS